VKREGGDIKDQEKEKQNHRGGGEKGVFWGGGGSLIRGLRGEKTNIYCEKDNTNKKTQGPFKGGGVGGQFRSRSSG